MYKHPSPRFLMITMKIYRPSLIFIYFHWFSLIFNKSTDFHWFLLIFIDFHIHWFLLIFCCFLKIVKFFYWFALNRIDFHKSYRPSLIPIDPHWFSSKLILDQWMNKNIIWKFSESSRFFRFKQLQFLIL